MSEWLGLLGRRVLVAGVGGIGGACALAFAQSGARVMAVDVSDSRLHSLQADANSTLEPISVLQADLSSGSACRYAVAQVAKTLGGAEPGIDVFVHAIGINDRQSMLGSTDELWDQILAVNLSTAYWLGQAVGRLMCSQEYGRIVYLSSVSAKLAHPNHAPYAASKGGLNQLLKVMAREWATTGVTVNGVAPGYTETDLTRDYLAKPGVSEQLVSLVPAGRLGAADEVVGPILFLASKQASFITGQVLYVDGGRTLV